MRKHPLPAARRGLITTIVVLTIFTVLTIIPGYFPSDAVTTGNGLIERTSSHVPGLENFDIRTDKDHRSAQRVEEFRASAGLTASAIADVRDGFVRGEESLRTRVSSVKVEYTDRLSIPEVISPDMWKANIERLTGTSGMKRADALRNFAKQNNELIGMEPGQVDELKVLADYENPNGYLGFAHLEQRIDGIPVFQGEIKAGFTKNGEIIRVINNLAPGLEYGSLSRNFGDPLAVVKAAAGYINNDMRDMDLRRNESASDDLKVVFGEGDNATVAEKFYFPTEPGVARAAWRVNIWEPVTAWMVVVDAETGTLLWRKNAGEDQTQSATFEVYGNPSSYIDVADSPAPLSPGPIDPGTGTQGAIISRTNRTLIGNEGPMSFNNNGWITDGANHTDGNAVEAGVDRVSPDGVDAPQLGDTACPGAGCRVFTSTWNPPPGNPAPGDDPLTAQAQRGAVIQMFYVMNKYHDVMYQLGWTEQAFNFQDDNFGRGGTAGDRVRAEGQDSSGSNNANMQTLADGTRGRMQMYLWTGPTPDYDGTTDADVIIHEITHGLSNRLHGNASGLSTNMARGMGEGWSDWYAHTLLAEPTDPVNGVYSLGGYATYLVTSGFNANYYYGIRRFPKAVMAFTGGPGNLPHNPLTFGNLNSGNCGTFQSAFPRGPIGSATDCDQVHNAGEIWSSALWEVRALMVNRLGFQAGTLRALQVVTDGMKLAPIGPTFLQERDAIIAAASALPVQPEASADVADVREGFRIRGMGFSAEVLNAGTGSVVEAFDFPNIQVVDPFSVSDAPGDNDGFPEPGEDVTLTVSVINATGSTINNVNVAVDGGTPVSIGNIDDGQTVPVQLAYTVPGDVACGAMHQVSVSASSDVGAQTPVEYSFRVGTPVGGAPLQFENTTPITIPSSGPATPYPSTISVSGVTGARAVKLQLVELNSGFPDDVDFLVEGPNGGTLIFLSDAGGSNDWVDDTVNITDLAENLAPDSGAMPSGDYKPTNYGANDPFDAPAPAGPHGNAAPAGTDTFESEFGTDGSQMNGDWKLYIDDDLGGFAGTVDGGWKLIFESNEYVCNIAVIGDGRADFDGDGRTDVSVFRGSEGNWYINQSTDGFTALNWGIASDILVPADYDNDGKTDTAIFRATADASQPDFYVLNSNGFTVSGYSWGFAGDVPVVADYDGDGHADIAIYRESEGLWYILKSSDGGNIIVSNPGDTPVPGDYDGDGNADGIMFTDGTWTGNYSGGGTMNASFGEAGDIPVPGHFDNDNKVDYAVYRPSTGTWHILRSEDAQTLEIPFGISTDVPVPGDYDGDGRDDVAVYRDGTWWIFGSTSGLMVQNFGVSTDDPIVAAARP